MERVLLIDDAPAAVEPVAYALERAAFEVEMCETLAEGRQALAKSAPDFVILDLGLPDGDGMELCRELRASGSIPILLLTARDGEVDRILGLELGADDYVTKPCSPREIVARVKRILARARPSTDPLPSLVLGKLEIRAEEHRALLDGVEVELTVTELTILRTLVAAPKRVLSRDALIDRVHGVDVHITARTIDSHVRGIRKKFARVRSAADPIETVFGVGYRARRID